MGKENFKTIGPIEEGIHIKSVKVNLQKCGINGGMGIPNICGRMVMKHVIFPVARIKYSQNNIDSEDIDAKITVNLDNALLTTTNFEGVGCGKNYFIVSNGTVYSLYDINGCFNKYINISVSGKIIYIGATSFFTLSNDGKIHKWDSAGTCYETIQATPENLSSYGLQKGKLLKKSESFSRNDTH